MLKVIGTFVLSSFLLAEGSYASSKVIVSSKSLMNAKTMAPSKPSHPKMTPIVIPARPIVASSKNIKAEEDKARAAAEQARIAAEQAKARAAAEQARIAAEQAKARAAAEQARIAAEQAKARAAAEQARVAAEQEKARAAAEQARIAAEQEKARAAAEQERAATSTAVAPPTFRAPIVVELIFNQRQNGQFQGCEVGIMKSGLMAAPKCAELPQVKSGQFKVINIIPEQTGAMEDRANETCQVRSFFTCELQ